MKVVFNLYDKDRSPLEVLENIERGQASTWKWSKLMDQFFITDDYGNLINNYKFDLAKGCGFVTGFNELRM